MRRLTAAEALAMLMSSDFGFDYGTSIDMLKTAVAFSSAVFPTVEIICNDANPRHPLFTVFSH